jgi:sensor c-di-GMP phosphodiesterase-like protein
MKRPHGIIIAIVIGVIALVAPLWLSIQLAWQQSVADEEARVRGFAIDGVTRTDRVSSQLLNAVDRLRMANLPPCSPEEVALMRQIDLDSRYLQAVGRLSGNTLVCDSQGSQPFDAGPATFYTEDGSAERSHFQFPFGKSQPMPSSLRMYSRDGFGVVIDGRISLDTPMDAGGLIDLFRPSWPNPFSAASQPDKLRPEWYKPIEKGSAVTFVDGGYVIALARSRTYDHGIIAASPLMYAQQSVARFALVYVSIGLACGVALAWATYSISRRSMALSSILRGAARRREFEVEYQPIVDLESSRWVGAEALLRWRRDGQNIRPDLFIPVAEESGVITEITACVMEIVARDLPGLMTIDPNFYVSINLSAADLKSAQTEARLAKVMQASGAHGRNLKMEATERGVLESKEVSARLGSIRAMGVKVAIDDFGTGYSSLSALQSLEVDALKIDKSFVDTIGTGGATSEVVLHIIRLARSLKLELVAEGVENAAQAEFLRQRGVERAQGWHYAKSLPIQTLSDRLSAQRLENEAA